MTPQLQTLSDISTDTLWSLGKYLEHDPHFMDLAPEFTRWLHAELIAEHKRRISEPEAPSRALTLPSGWTPALLADFLRGSTALSYGAANQDPATCVLLDSLTIGIAVLAANTLAALDGPATSYKAN